MNLKLYSPFSTFHAQFRALVPGYLLSIAIMSSYHVNPTRISYASVTLIISSFCKILLVNNFVFLKLLCTYCYLCFNMYPLWAFCAYNCKYAFKRQRLQQSSASVELSLSLFDKLCPEVDHSFAAETELLEAFCLLSSTKLNMDSIKSLPTKNVSLHVSAIYHQHKVSFDTFSVAELAVLPVLLRNSQGFLWMRQVFLFYCYLTLTLI